MPDKKLNTADNIRKTAAEIEEMTERVHDLARQNVELTRQAHALVHDTPDLSSLAGGTAATDETQTTAEVGASSSDVPQNGAAGATTGSSTGEEPDEEIAGHS